MASTNPVDLLITYTGYYALDGRPGAFVLVDTNLIYALDGATAIGTNTATITIAMDDVSSTIYAFDGHCSFDGRTLTVTDDGRLIASLNFYKDDNQVSAFSGTIHGDPVTARTPFNPIQLPVFATDYFTIGGQDVMLRIGADYSVFCRLNDGILTRIDEYSYNYAMFVIEFTAGGETNAFEMGTAMGFGRVAGNSARAGLLVSIRQVNREP